MPFKKGDKNINRKGRAKGSSFSLKLREQVTTFCEENALEFMKEIKAMKPGHAKAQAFLVLLNYAIPKITENNSTIDIAGLSDDELDKILTKYLENEN